MTIHLPKELESSVRAQVLSGLFASEDDMVATAVSEYLRQHQAAQQRAAHALHTDADPILGSMSDHAELMEEIVEDAMRHREQQPWRLPQ